MSIIQCFYLGKRDAGRYVNQCLSNGSSHAHIEEAIEVHVLDTNTLKEGDRNSGEGPCLSCYQTYKECERGLGLRIDSASPLTPLAEIVM